MIAIYGAGRKGKTVAQKIRKYERKDDGNEQNRAIS